MKTLSEYANFLYKNGYNENFCPFTFLDCHLESVEFIKNDFHLILGVEETKEFSNHLSLLKPDEEYQIEYENYIVNSAFIESPICNLSNYFDGSTNGIELNLEPNSYNKHTLDLFELCIGFQKINLLEHEMFIMSKCQEHFTWAKDNLIPILEKYDYYIDYDSFFNTKQERHSSNMRIDFKHPNLILDNFVIEVDCLTGEPIIWTTVKNTDDISLTDKIYGKSQNEVFDVLLEEVWKKDELKFGYIYNNDPHETVETCKEVLYLMECLHYKEIERNINFGIIPKRYNHLIEEYKLLLENKIKNVNYY